MAEYSYTVLFEPAEEGSYVAFCPALLGLVTEGETYEEVRERVKEAIEGYLESLLKDGLEIPADNEDLFGAGQRRDPNRAAQNCMSQHLPARKPVKYFGLLSERASTSTV